MNKRKERKRRIRRIITENEEEKKKKNRKKGVIQNTTNKETNKQTNKTRETTKPLQIRGETQKFQILDIYIRRKIQILRTISFTNISSPSNICRVYVAATHLLKMTHDREGAAAIRKGSPQIAGPCSRMRTE